MKINVPVDEVNANKFFKIEVKIFKDFGKPEKGYITYILFDIVFSQVNLGTFGYRGVIMPTEVTIMDPEKMKSLISITQEIGSGHRVIIKIDFSEVAALEIISAFSDEAVKINVYEWQGNGIPI